MTILPCPYCGNEIYISNEDCENRWQCDACGQWCDFFGCKTPPPDDTK